MQTDRQGSIKELFVTVVGLTIESHRHTNSVDVQIKIVPRSFLPLSLHWSSYPTCTRSSEGCSEHDGSAFKPLQGGDTYEVASPIIDVGSQRNSIQCCDTTLEVDHLAHVWSQCLRGFHWKTQEQLWQDDVV